MLDAFRRRALVIGATAVVAVGVTGIADAATSTTSKKSTTTKAKKKATSKAKKKATRSPAGNPAETALTGDTLASATSAAEGAVPGGTVERASTEDPSDASGAAYEVHVTKTDGSEVEVLLDSSFKVLAVNASKHGGHGRDGAFHPNENGTHESSESAAREAQEDAGKAPTTP
jgi:hypothetical protein